MRALAAKEMHRAFIAPDMPHQRLKKRRLARAVVADEPVDLPAAHADRDLIERPQLSVSYWILTNIFKSIVF